jgi:catechol 2,3-dioxygenase-like lactoylglutathione lyase family enzyme
VEVPSSRILLRPADLSRSRRFYRDILGLAVFREFGSPADPAMVFFLGAGLLEVSGRALGADRAVDRGPGRRPDRPGRGSRRSPAPPRSAIATDADADADADVTSCIQQKSASPRGRAT